MCLAAAGDDPNYWMALTHQAEAQEFAVKVQNLIAELNKQNSKKVGSDCTCSCCNRHGHGMGYCTVMDAVSKTLS
jgi:hypothetical protein